VVHQVRRGVTFCTSPAIEKLRQRALFLRRNLAVATPIARFQQFSPLQPGDIMQRVSIQKHLLHSLVGISLLGCTPLGTNDKRQELASISPTQSRDIDILFVVDNSGSMMGEQKALADNFSGFMRQLQGLPGGLPNLHIAVTSTDMGTLDGVEIGNCQGLGNNGQFLLGDKPTFDGKAYLVDEDGAGSNPRNKNYEGTLEEAFARAARIGANGCGFEQPLAAMKQALGPANEKNAGFLRTSATLVVVFLTDEDDCSVSDPAFFSDQGIGTLDSYRCFSQGVICDSDPDPNQVGERTNCRPRENSRYQASVEAYTEWLVELKGDPRRVMVSAVMGPTDPSSVMVGLSEFAAVPAPILQPSCQREYQGSFLWADPAIRLNSFLDAFPGRDRRHSICDDNFAQVLDRLGSSARRLADASCLEQEPAVRDDGSFDCDVVEVPWARSSSQTTERTLPVCTESVLTDCYQLVTDRQRCPNTASGTRLVVNRSTSTTAERFEVARCNVVTTL
jgi:hypothetical protein